jgi:hypothetical protein
MGSVASGRSTVAVLKNRATVTLHPPTVATATQTLRYATDATLRSSKKKIGADGPPQWPRHPNLRLRPARPMSPEVLLLFFFGAPR